MRYLYSFFIYCYGLAVRIAGRFNAKAKLWVEGRKNLLSCIQKTIDKDISIAWFHVASLGEFEQGRPLMEKFKQQYPRYKILLTFFSPSGYEIRKNTPLADYVFYLPLDTPRNARKFIEIVNPKIVFFVKYEFWFNFLYCLKKAAVPTYIISVIFRPSQHFFKFYGSWTGKQLTVFTHFFVQNQQSVKLLRSIGFNNVTLAGDTRFDRVYTIAMQAKEFPLIEKFKQNKKLIVVGSSWPEDEEFLKPFVDNLPSDCKIIFAPHEIDENHISKIRSLFSADMLRYSLANEENIENVNILIIDSIGMLSSLYRYAEIAFIGGAFGKGLHNILEAVTFGIPVYFGPNYKKFQEAVDLVEAGGAFPVTIFRELEAKLSLLLRNEVVYKQTSDICKQYIASKKGATDIIMRCLGKSFSATDTNEK